MILSARQGGSGVRQSLNSEAERFEFADREALAEALAGTVASRLRSGIETRGSASLAVSGGSTPRLFFQKLSDTEIDWDRVGITLVDERWVPESSERSNARLVRETLLQNRSAVAKFEPLYSGHDQPEAGLDSIARRIDALVRPFDAVILGLGTDGHTASFFPGGDRLAEAIDLAGTAPLWPMRAPGAGETRITLSLPRLLATRFLALHVEGPDKDRALADAQKAGPVEDMPVRAVLRQAMTPLKIYSCPAGQPVSGKSKR